MPAGGASGSSSEKSQLIPVLSTILKLSPAEVDSLQKVVASDMANSSLTAAEAANAAAAAATTSDVGWTSYLGLWSN